MTVCAAETHYETRMEDICRVCELILKGLAFWSFVVDVGLFPSKLDSAKIKYRPANMIPRQ